MSSGSNSSGSLSSDGKRHLGEELGIDPAEYGALLLSGEDMEQRQIQKIITGNDLADSAKKRGGWKMQSQEAFCPSTVEIDEERPTHKTEV